MTAIYDYAHYAFMACASRNNHNLPHRLGFTDLPQPESLRFCDFDAFYNNAVLDAGYINTALCTSKTERDLVQMQLDLREHGVSFLKRNWLLEEAITDGPKAFEDKYESALGVFDSIILKGVISESMCFTTMLHWTRLDSQPFLSFAGSPGYRGCFCQAEMR